MAIERIGLSLDLVERINQPFATRRIRHPLRVAVVPLDRAELGHQVFLAADPLARHPWIQEKGMEAHLDRNVRLERDRLLQPAFADEAPGTDDVGYHLDRQGHDRLLAWHFAAMQSFAALKRLKRNLACGSD